MRITHAPLGDIARAKNICIGAFQHQPVSKQEFFSHLSPSVGTLLEQFAAQEFRGEEGEVKSLWFGKGDTCRVVLFGLGEQTRFSERKLPLLPRRMVQYAKKEGIKEFTTVLPSWYPDNKEEAAHLFAVNAVMADFEFTKYKEQKKDGTRKLAEIILAGEAKEKKAIEEGIRNGMIVGEEANLCRELANTPGSDMTPALLAEEAKKTMKRTGCRIRVLDDKDMQRLGMGAILGVGQGSVEKPRFIIIEYLKGPKNQPPVVIAGKGVTFDTGGLNLKPDNYIYEMHMDMSGGAAVIHGIAAIARLKFPINIVGLIPAAENMPSGSSYRPGDLLKSLSGKTIEVLNTDAEGRVILADALTYGLRYKPEIMMDIATLTGAAHVALGSYASALFTNDDKLRDALLDIGIHSGDYLWPLPLWDEFLPEIKGTFGDLANTGVKDRYGGASQGAKFLEQFAGGTRFVHLDIAPRMTTIDSEFLSKGASGVGVRLITEIGARYSKLLNS